MQAYPEARISLIGDAKLTGLLGGCPALHIVPLKYQRRGSLAERLASWLQLDTTIQELQPDLIIGPDSRLDQLGMLPLGSNTATATATDQQEDAAEIPYLLWENTIDDQPISIADHLDAWCRSRWPAHQPVAPRCWPDQATLDLQQRLSAALGPHPIAAIKLDHGGNTAKSLPREAEVQALKTLRQQGWRILLDRGFGDEEYANSDALLNALEKDFLEHGKEGESWSADDICDLDDSGKDMGLPPETWTPNSLASHTIIRFHGSIAGWLAALRCCQFALSYDSVGQHLAAASAVPLHCWFTGHQHDLFPIAWQPRGTGDIRVQIIPTDQRHNPQEWSRLCADLPTVNY